MAGSFKTLNSVQTKEIAPEEQKEVGRIESLLPSASHISFLNLELSLLHSGGSQDYQTEEQMRKIKTPSLACARQKLLVTYPVALLPLFIETDFISVEHFATRGKRPHFPVSLQD